MRQTKMISRPLCNGLSIGPKTPDLALIRLFAEFGPRFVVCQQGLLGCRGQTIFLGQLAGLLFGKPLPVRFGFDSLCELLVDKFRTASIATGILQLYSCYIPYEPSQTVVGIWCTIGPL